MKSRIGAIAQAAPAGIAKVNMEVRSDTTGEVFMMVPIALQDDSITIEVPAGAARRFTVASYLFDVQLPTPDYRRIKGGHAVADLSPDDTVSAYLNTSGW